MHCMITMHARPRPTDKQTDEHYGNTETIRTSNRANNYKKKNKKKKKKSKKKTKTKKMPMSR